MVRNAISPSRNTANAMGSFTLTSSGGIKAAKIENYNKTKNEHLNFTDDMPEIEVSQGYATFGCILSSYRMKKKQIISTVIFILNLAIVVGLIIVFTVVGVLDDLFVFDTINITTIVASLIFAITIIYALKNDKKLSFLLPFLLVAFPTTFNNIFPGIYLESSTLGTVVPITLHIELALICILLKKYQINRLILLRDFTIVNIMCALFLFATIINIIFANDSHSQLILVAHLYPVKIALLIMLLIANFKFDIHHYIKGIAFSIVFLFLESVAYTYSIGNNILGSGSLGINTFGNIISQLAVLLLFYKYNYKSRNSYIGIILLAIIMVFLSTTRMAILSMIMMLCIIVFPTLTSINKLRLLILGSVTIFIASLFFVQSSKFNVIETVGNIKLSSGGGNLLENIEISKSESTMSLITRLKLFQTSINMFTENPICGIGYGMFNIDKYKYGFSTEIIIDSHNGYLFILSQLGLSGVLLLFLLYIYPTIVFFKSRDRCVKCLCIINMGIAFADLTNAGIYKYQIYSLLVFNAIMILHYQKISKFNDKIESFTKR